MFYIQRVIKPLVLSLIFISYSCPCSCLNTDSTELLEDQLRGLPPAKSRNIRERLETVPEDRRQLVFDIVFRSILGHAGNATDILENQMLETLGSISGSLEAISGGQFSHVSTVANTIFGSDYFDTDADYFELEDRLSLFRSFVTSKDRHLIDSDNRSNLLFVYHIIYNCLRSMGIDPEEICSPVYLSSFANSFRDTEDEELKKICRTITGIYSSDTYTELKGVHGCEDWELLANQLRVLNATQRETMSDFLSWFPATFNFGPADAVEVFKAPAWFEKIDRLESFEDVGTLFQQVFKTHEEQDRQLEVLDIIITGLLDKKPHNKILKSIE